MSGYSCDFLSFCPCKNVPSTYQWLMEECLGDLHLFVWSSWMTSYSLTRLKSILVLVECGLKLNPKKCSFCQEKVKYVGNIVSANEIETDPEKCDKVVNWLTPRTPEEVRQFLGFAGYYRCFVKGFSKIAKPLTDLMPSPTKGKKKKEKRSTEKSTREVDMRPRAWRSVWKAERNFGFASGFGFPWLQ